ncbi:hypothetical protein PghCCS26_47480 [Paenibacillus glycanilyticus]|uniref:Uncharacterized protein n=1 Tax=Paenibacillus glycanilyticus TaxID=126569 RepID=A0ABQ6NST3_9BACL|nr:hypothetical protein [Paenibacillus glycanilyticus]GMK47618.1 hypothetical protein PghCCS26_47480 [Paenibacillus glycanilyticus]
MSFAEDIVRHISEMPEKEAKRKLAEIILNREKIGRNNYTKENFLDELNQMTLEIVAGDIFK